MPYSQLGKRMSPSLIKKATQTSSVVFQKKTWLIRKPSHNPQPTAHRRVRVVLQIQTAAGRDYQPVFLEPKNSRRPSILSVRGLHQMQNRLAPPDGALRPATWCSGKWCSRPARRDQYSSRSNCSLALPRGSIAYLRPDGLAVMRCGAYTTRPRIWR